MQIAIGPLSEADWPDLERMWHEAIATGHTTFTAKPPESYAKFVDGKLEAGRLIARDENGVALGWTVLAKMSAREVYAGVVEVSIGVAEHARGKGVGTVLMREMIAKSEAVGIWTLQSVIFPENAASIALHERAGFRLVGRRERIGLMPGGPLAGKWRDTLLFERRSAVAGV